MVQVQLAELLRRRGKTYYWLWKQTGVPHTTFMHLGKGETQSITFRTLEAICLALECTPNDFLKVVKRKG